jgi:hypothetical protein
VRIEFNEVNPGSPFKQWNKSGRLARGEYVWIAESDDYADKRLLEKLSARLEAEPRGAFACCRSVRVSADNRLEGFVDTLGSQRHPWTADYCADGLEECRNYLVRGNTVPNATAVVFRKDVYQRDLGEPLHGLGVRQLSPFSGTPTVARTWRYRLHPALQHVERRTASKGHWMEGD